MNRQAARTVVTLVSLVVCVMGAHAADWTNSGGNALRNGLTTETGPVAEDLLWSGGQTSLIAWQPVTEGNRVFMVRQADWPGNPQDSLVVAMDLTTGEELWSIEIPAESGDWTTWIAGVKNGLVFASRGGNGASVWAPLYALNVEDGSTAWVSVDDVNAGAYDGVVFAPDGDPVIGSIYDIWRIDADTGITVWHADRTGSVSSSCGGAVFGDAVYIVDAAPGGHVVVKYDLATGDYVYESDVMSGFTLQNTPFTGSDGTIYISRTQNNPATDFFYGWTDDGVEFKPKWNIPAAWTTTSEFGEGPDGSIYAVIPGPALARLHPDDGSVIDSVSVPDTGHCRLAVDAAGTVYFSNGGFADGHLYAYTADLNPLWDTAVTNINIGGPALGQGGVLVVCGVGTDVRAYRSDPTPTPTPGECLHTGDVTLDGEITAGDAQLAFLIALGAHTPTYDEECAADCNGDGEVTAGDAQAIFLTALGQPQCVDP